MHMGTENGSISKNEASILNALTQLDSGQQQILKLQQRALELQLRQLEIVLKTQESAKQQLAQLQVFPMAVCQDDSHSIREEANVPVENDMTHLKTDRIFTPRDDDAPKQGQLTFMKKISEAEKQVKTEDFKAYLGAMGWHKTLSAKVDSMFPVDPRADCLTRFASGPIWTFVCIALILANTIIIGVETQLTTSRAISEAMSGQSQATTSSSASEDVFRALEIAFLVWMIVEVIVNAFAQKRDFLFGSDWHWNAFDVTVLVCSLALQFMDTGSVSFLRVMRLFRLGKILRSFRYIKFLRSVRSMLISISGSIMHLFSAMLVMCIFMYVVSLVIMQGVATDVYKVAAQQKSGIRSLANVFDQSDGLTDVEEINVLYGSLDRTMMTLFLTISGGLEWSKAAEPVSQLNTFYGVVWTAYIAFMAFGLLNVLTGIFCEAAIDAMTNDRDNMIQAQLEEKEGFIATIAKVFQNSDSDGSGNVSEAELELLLQDEELIAYLNAIGVDSTEARGLFRLLDDDASGAVSIDEFVTGFLRLKGGAKSVDMVSLMYENRKMSMKLTKIFEETRTLHGALAILQQCMTPRPVVVSTTRQSDQGSPGLAQELMESIQALGIREYNV